MFFNVLALYMVAIIYSHWVQGLIQYSQRSMRVLDKYRKKQEELFEKY